MRAFLALTLSFASLLAPGLGPAEAANGETWSAKLLDLTATYGVETWKYDAVFGTGASPDALASHIANETTSYYGAVGLRVTAKVEIFDPNDETTRATSSHNVTASIDTSRGPIFALVRRESGAAPGPSDSKIFYLDFDMDGANHADPLGRQVPAAEPGLKQVHVNVLKRTNDAAHPVVDVGEAALAFTYDIPAQTPSSPAFTGVRYLQAVPDSIFRLFTDVGWDASLLSLLRPLRSDQGLTVEYRFATQAANQTVELYGLAAQRSAAQAVGGQSTPNVPAPVPSLPFIPGVSDNETVSSLLGNTDRLVVVSKTLLATGVVDAAGVARFTLNATALLNVRSAAPPASMVVLAPTLLSNFRPEACANPCQGGAQFRVGATELAVPVSDYRAEIDGYQLMDPALTGSEAPPPLHDAVAGANALEVYVKDVSGLASTDTRTGDLYALVADVRSSDPLSGTGLAPNVRDDAVNPNLLSGRLPVASIQAQHVSFYRVLALLYTANDEFYGMAWGDRGYTLQLAAPPAPTPPGSGGLWLNFTSRTTNYDARADQSSFEVRVVFEVAAPELNVNATQDVLLKEAQSSAVFFPLARDKAGEVPVTVNATTGDVLPRARTVNALWVAPGGKRGLFDGLPGFEIGLAAAAAVAVGAAVALRRRLM